jgi:hypothetical protein
MSYVPGERALDPKTHFKAGMEDLFRVDKVRFLNINGTIQYGLLYGILYLFCGILINNIFPAYTTNIQLRSLFMWIILQSIVIIIATFYSQKFVEAIPGWASLFPGFFNPEELKSKGWKPYGIPEYKGDMAASIILIGTQINLLKKIELFTRKFSKKYL